MPVEPVAPGLERIVSLDQDVEELGTGTGASRSPRDPYGGRKAVTFSSATSVTIRG